MILPAGAGHQDRSAPRPVQARPLRFPDNRAVLQIESDDERIKRVEAVAVVIANEDDAVAVDDRGTGQAELRVEFTEHPPPDLLAGEVVTDDAGIAEECDHVGAIRDWRGSGGFFPHSPGQA